MATNQTPTNPAAPFTAPATRFELHTACGRQARTFAVADDAQYSVLVTNTTLFPGASYVTTTTARMSRAEAREHFAAGQRLGMVQGSPVRLAA